ncbi:MAG: ROK family protein [Actinomycetota bacterium]|nr:ROK family protein [Actinomycetota bacterium]
MTVTRATPGASSTASAAPKAPAPKRKRPATLAIDIGGSGLKASVLDGAGAMLADRVRIPTTYPMPPDALVQALTQLVAQLPAFDRVSVGFPGMVRQGRVLTAPVFSTVSGPGSNLSPELEKAWSGYPLADALTARLERPTKVANDADLQGSAVVSGHGLELVITLGTGFGTAMFHEGHLMPHLEIGHQPFRKGETYDNQLGEAARKKIGNAKWSKRVKQAVDNLHALMWFDHLYVGGGNGKHLKVDLGAKATVVDNSAGILGGIKLWERDSHQMAG